MSVYYICLIFNILIMLSDFFRINLPRGMERNNKGKWIVFNRDYKPIGFNQSDFVKYEEFPIYTKYKGLTEKLILEIGNPDSIERDEHGKICKFWLYNDVTNPMNNNDWSTYWKKLQKLAKLQRSNKK